MSEFRSSRFQKYALIWYFLLAFLISWIFWFVEPHLREKDPLLATFLIQLGTYGPILAAMLVSSLSTFEKKHTPVWPRLLAGSIALGVAIFSNWLVAEYVITEVPQLFHFFLLAALTILPAWIFFSAHSKERGLNDLLNSLTRWRINPLWFLVALFLMPALRIVGMLITSLIDGTSLSSWFISLENQPIMRNLALIFFATALYGGPLGEEAGWRGFALPQLQKHFDPLLSSVFLGLIWGFWHLPLHVTGYYDQVFGSPWNGLLLRIFTNIPLAVIFTWLYNRSHGNLLIMVVLHTSVNVSSALFAPNVGMYITITIAVIMMVIFDRMYKMPDTEQPTQIIVNDSPSKMIEGER
jgi:membrane protease YdiL (CAAX protease family)